MMQGWASRRCASEELSEAGRGCPAGAGRGSPPRVAGGVGVGESGPGYHSIKAASPPTRRQVLAKGTVREIPTYPTLPSQEDIQDHNLTLQAARRGLRLRNLSPKVPGVSEIK